VIAIDGPAGAGKTTIARRVARTLGWLHVDTGAMYRALAWNVLQHGCDPDHERAVLVVTRARRLRLTPTRHGTLRVFLNGDEITRQIRRPEVSALVSRVARHRRVRHWMVQRQRAMARRRPVVMEGRDIGTVVFPHARWKFFLSASLTERARRRHAELTAEGERVTRAQVMHDVRLRDRLDRHRPLGALKAAPDARRLDTTHLSVREVAQRMLEVVRGCCC